MDYSKKILFMSTVFGLDFPILFVVLAHFATGLKSRFRAVRVHLDCWGPANKKGQLQFIEFIQLYSGSMMSKIHKSIAGMYFDNI